MWRRISQRSRCRAFWTTCSSLTPRQTQMPRTKKMPQALVPGRVLGSVLVPALVPARHRERSTASMTCDPLEIPVLPVNDTQKKASHSFFCGPLFVHAQREPSSECTAIGSSDNTAFEPGVRVAAGPRALCV